MAASDPSDATISATLSGCVELAQRGDLVGARANAEKALAAAADEPPPLLAFLGMVAARQNDPEAAAQYLRKAHEARPDDVTIACNLIALLSDIGQPEAALKVASAKLATADKSLRVARYRGFLAQQVEQFEAAVAAYEMVLAANPADFECWNNLGNALAGAGDYPAAVTALERAISLDPAAAPARLNLGSALQNAGREDEALATYENLAHDFPVDTRALAELYVLHKLHGRDKQALAALEGAVDRDPNSAEFQLKLGIEYGVQRDTDRAERAYRRTIELDPTEASAYIGLAIQYEHTNREEQFAPLIESARSNGITTDQLAFIEALELRRQKRFEEALAKLNAVPHEVELVRTTHMRATLLDRLGRSDEAFASFARANELLSETPTEPLNRAEELRDKICAEIELLTPAWHQSWQTARIDDPRPDPVFLVGFPRSGTTLLDTILMGHPDAVVMEEQPPLNNVEEQFGGLAAVPAMDTGTIAAARAQYFADVDKLEAEAAGKLLVDKSPLFLYRLPLIRRLFPKARVILALRHPCDVVLSCLMSNFRLNSAMANFLRVEDAAAFYDICFSHWQASRTLLPNDIHTIRYEELVADVEQQIRPLLKWLELGWDDAVLDHTRTAKSRGLITTASYSQVVEPIYMRSVGRWARYRSHLTPALKTLAPWVEQHGYDPL